MHEQLHGSILIISHQERILNIADQSVIADGKLVKKGTKGRGSAGASGNGKCGAIL